MDEINSKIRSLPLHQEGGVSMKALRVEILDILIKKSEEMIEINTSRFIERLRNYLHSRLEQVEIEESFKSQLEAHEPEAPYSARLTLQDKKPDDDEYISGLCNLLDLDNIRVIDSLKEDLKGCGIIFPDNYNIDEDDEPEA